MDSSNFLSDLPPRIVGFAGRAGSGKDTAGAILQAFRYERISFATPLKRALAAMGFPEPLTQEFKEKEIPSIGKSWRHLAQTIGTEWGRNLVHPDIWTTCAAKILLENPTQHYVFTDVRFENEATMIRKLDGIIVHLRGRERVTSNDAHQSEAGIAVLEDDFLVDNGGTIQELADRLKCVCNLT